MRHVKLAVIIHFVWRTAGNRPLITPEIAREVYRHIAAVCTDNRCPVLAVGGTSDHVHLLVLLSNVITIAQLMHRVKGSSSRFVNEYLRAAERFEWQGGYGVFGVSASHKRRMIDYIRNQKRHHEAGTLWPSAETSAEEGE